MWTSLSGFTIERIAWNLAIRDLERHHADRRARAVEEQGARLAVDLDAGAVARPPSARPGAARPPACGRRGRGRERARQRRHLAAAVAVQHHVLGEQGLERREVAVAGGGEEALGRARRAAPATASKRGRRSSTWRRARAASWRTLASLCRRSSAISLVAVVEDVVQQEHRPLLGRQALEQHEERQRQRVGRLGRARRGRRRASPTIGSGSHSPTYVSRRTRAERSWSIASRVVTVARYARGDSIGSPATERRCTRSSASWTTSSASATLPSMR